MYDSLVRLATDLYLRTVPSYDFFNVFTFTRVLTLLHVSF